MPKRVLEGRDASERVKQRQKLGTLRELTVQSPTRARYDKALNGFLNFLHENGLKIPHQRDALDPLVCDYLEHLWSSGAGRGLASDTVASLQDFMPKLRHHLPGAWRLLKTWSINEIPNRAPPFPEHVVHGLCGWAAFHGHFAFAISLLIGFYGMMRTGEILALHRKDFYSESSSKKVLISLGLTKGGKRTGAAESIVLAHDTVVNPIKRWMALTQPSDFLTCSPTKWRALFSQAISSLKLEEFGFRPYSLRRGGATWWFGKHHSLDKILVQGRWQAARTARIYLNEGLAVLAELQLKPSDPRLKPFLTQFRTHLHNPKFATLSPPVKTTGRSGGRGKGVKSKFSMKKEGASAKIFSLKIFSLVLRAFPGEGVWPVLGGRTPNPLTSSTLGSGPSFGRGKERLVNKSF